MLEVLGIYDFLLISIIYPITCAGLAKLWHFCLSPHGIASIISDWFAYQLGIEENVGKQRKWEAITTEKNIFFAAGLCPTCFGFWLSFAVGVYAAITFSFFALPYIIASTHLIINLKNE